MRHIFISPHMDDAVLSAGNLILKLKKQKKRAFIITVFTEFGREPISFKSRRYLYDSGFFDLQEFARKRKKEEEKAMEKLGVEYFHLGFIDGGFRKRKNASLFYELISWLAIGKKYVYPEGLFSGKIALDDNPLFKKIYLKLRREIKSSDILYGPLGIGNHADHLIIREVLSYLPNKKYYWVDQPYSTWKGVYKQLKHLQTEFKKAFTVKENPQKREIVNCYSSQIKCLFSEGIKLKKEVYYEEKN